MTFQEAKSIARHLGVTLRKGRFKITMAETAFIVMMLNIAAATLAWITVAQVLK